MLRPFLVRRRELLAGLLSLTTCRKKADLPVLGQLGEFTLMDQNGRPTRASDLRGKPWVAAFMFTRCPTICPRITRRMQALQVRAKERDVPLELVSFSVDPEHDTPEVLRAYAARFKADQSSWRFLTGDFDVVRKTSVEGFKLALQGRPDPQKEHMGLLHGSHLVLVDGELRLRGFYRTDSDEELGRLLADLETL